MLASAGPIKTPVGACATAAQSLELGVEAIRSRKARIVIAGGFDDFGEEGSYEFASMRATVNCEDEVQAGREPREMSRPTASTRAGFVESHGAGVQVCSAASLHTSSHGSFHCPKLQVLCAADLALAMGLPIFAIVGLVSTATDGQGRSVPAPGQGILTTARETVSLGRTNPLLDSEYRKRNLMAELAFIDKWAQGERAALQEDHGDLASTATPEQRAEQERMLDSMVQRRLQQAKLSWGNDFWLGEPSIAPLRGAMAVYGLSIDQLEVASFHGTSTQKNDTNESEVLQKQLKHLGRSDGNCIFTIFQKYLTGHPKGAAAAWMMNGVVQAMLSGIVPGNRNADNVDEKLEKNSHLLYAKRPLHLERPLEAALLKSFGFGQVGGEVLLIHPDHILAQCTEAEYGAYVAKREQRWQKMFRHTQDAMYGKLSYVNIKSTPPMEASQQQAIFLDPLSRAVKDRLTGTYQIHPTTAVSEALKPPRSMVRSDTSTAIPAALDSSNDLTSMSEGRGMVRSTSKLSTTSLGALEVSLRETAEGMRGSADRGIGVDTQVTFSFANGLHSFLFAPSRQAIAAIRMEIRMQFAAGQ
jgi:3-oxoacyl-(acyl-carrier-protein) synthase